MAWNMQTDLLQGTEINLANTLIYQTWEESEIYGYPIKYIKATETQNNPIFSESTAREFLSTNGYNMSSKRDEDTLYTGSEVFGNFGYTPSYNQILYIAVKYFTDIEAITLLPFVPIEGDLIYDKTDNIFFEITKVDTKTETQSSLRINKTLLAHKIFLKQFKWSYNDNFDTSLTTELIDTKLTVQDLANINLELDTAIADLGIIDYTEDDSIFGEFK